MFESFQQPVLAAALVAGGVAIASLIVNSYLNTRLHRERVAADTTLAEKKFLFEKTLAEEKIRLDKDLQRWQTRVAFAETALRELYEAKVRLTSVRSPISFNAENSDRSGRNEENEEQRKARDKYYPSLKRLNTEGDFINGVLANRYRAEALFGAKAIVPYATLLELTLEIQGAAETLLYHFDHYWSDDGTLAARRELERTIWGRPNDRITLRLIEMRVEAETVFGAELGILEPELPLPSD